MTKKYLIIGIPIFAILIGIMVFLTYFFIELDRSKRAYYESFDPTTEIGKANLELDREIERKMEHEIKGSNYERQAKYNLAIEEYKKVKDEWISRSALSRIYEKAGRYEEAIKEIDWLISQRPRPDVIHELIQRKRKLQKLLEGSNKEAIK